MLISVKSLSRYFYIHSKVNLISLSVSKVNIIVNDSFLLPMGQISVLHA